MKGNAIVNIPQRKLFDVCTELNKYAFPVSRRDDALFYIRPDMCIRQQDFSTIFDETNRPWKFDKSLVDEFVYIPTEADLFKELGSSLTQLTKTLTAGWFAYTDIRAIEDSPEFIRGQGATPWFAMADAWISMRKWQLNENSND